MAQARLSLEGEFIAIRFDWDERIYGIVRNLPARRYEPAGGKRWLVPIEYAKTVFEALPGAWIDASLSPYQAKRQELERTRLLPDAPHPSDMACSLFPYQRAGIAFLRQLDSCLNRDEPGVGKTAQAIGWAIPRLDSQRGVHNLHGCLIVCPSSGKYKYRNWALRARPGSSTHVVEGQKGVFAPAGTDWVVVNWEILHFRQAQILAYGFSCVIFSEAHRCKAGRVRFKKEPSDPSKPEIAGGSLRGQAAIDVAAAIGKSHCETGSPVRNRPKELAAIFQVLGKLKQRDVFRWMVHFCDGHQEEVWVKTKFGPQKKKIWNFDGASNQEELAGILEQFSIGRRKSEVFGDIPPVTYAFPLVEISNRAEYNRMQKEMFALKDRLAKTKDFDEAKQLGGEILGYRIKLHQLGALGKVEAGLEIIEDSLGEDLKVVVFCDYLEPLYRVQEKFPTSSILIEGAMSALEKYEAVNKFQEDPKTRLALCSPAGYYDITLTKASTCMFMSLPPVPEDWKQARDRAAIRADNLNRSNINCITMLARKTMDAPQAALIYQKAGVIEPLVWHDREDREMIERFKDMVEVLAGKPPRRV